MPFKMFESFLKQHDSSAWGHTREALLPSIHAVDRNATYIWFHFFPLALAEAFAHTDNSERLSRALRLDGNCRLAEQIDTSHWFLYGHRYWPHVKAALVERAESPSASSSLDLATIVRDISKEAASGAGADESLLVGIVAVGLMTLQQIGLPAFRAGSGAVQIPPALARKSPAQILADRKKDDGQGIRGLFQGPDQARYSVTFDEGRNDGRFTAINSQQLTTASANDTHDYSNGPRRCHEGPIPVECRTASCGTCWIGVLAGAEKLSDVDEMEARRMKEFGYVNSTEDKPLIRLACMSIASGNVTIVIPPWNGFVGKAGLGS
ncbi:MAG: (2Fe-2S)-binding protein [Acidobacteria bacterium]|nr:(2Fe-2S)-binding protein [Acidobacteriota bacterium]